MEQNTTTKEAVVIICSIWTRRNATDVPARYTVRVPVGETPTQTLEHAFVLTNRDDRPHGRSVCSTSVGDIMQLEGAHYFVDLVGFKEITPAQSLAIQRLTSRDTGMGWDWLVEKGLVK